MFEQGVDVGSQIGLRRGHRRRACRARGERINEKAVPAVQHFVAGAGIGLGQQLQDFIGAGAAHDTRRVEAVEGAERIAQITGAAVGVAMQ